MAYRIDPGERTDLELRRVIGEQLVRAAAELRAAGGPNAEDIHDVRKRLKKARSAVRLGRADLGPAVARHANRELQRVGADLAQQRDADALVEAVDQLIAAVGREPGPTAEALAVTRRSMAERADIVRLDGALSRAMVLGAARTLEQTVSWLDLVPAQVTGWKALAPGFAREYGRGRKVWQNLPAEPTVEQLHEWRKRVKDLWYHQRLLRRLWTEGQRPVVEAAGELALNLGADRDLGLLLANLAPVGNAPVPELRTGVGPIGLPLVDAEIGSMVSDAARSLRSALQARARQLGSRLYADDPAAWAARHGAWWDATPSPREEIRSDPSPVGTNA